MPVKLLGGPGLYGPPPKILGAQAPGSPGIDAYMAGTEEPIRFAVSPCTDGGRADGGGSRSSPNVCPWKIFKFQVSFSVSWAPNLTLWVTMFLV